MKFPIIAASALLIAVQASAPAEAQTYPNRPIRMISPFPAGGGNDVLARIIAAKLSERLKATIY